MGSDLLDAIRANNLDAVEVAIARGVNPNARDPQIGLTCVMLAAGYGRPAILRSLLAGGGDVHAIDSRAGATSLHKACQGGSLECVRILVDAGAFVDAQCVSTGHTPLFEAIWFKQPHIVQFLLDRGAGLAIGSHYGFTLDQHLLYAETVNRSVSTELEKVVAARQMVAARRDQDAALEKSQLLMAATVVGDSARARELLASGASPDERFPIVNGFNDAHTPLLVASRDGHQEIVVALLAAGADVNATEPTFGAVPLHKAVYNGHGDITRILIASRGVNLDYQGATNGYTPLLDAIWHGFQDCALPLIEAGASLNLTGHDGKSPLQLAEEIFGQGHEVVKAIHGRLTQTA